MPSLIVFVSYSHKDERWVTETNDFNLIPWLAHSLRRDNVELWFDHALRKLPGEEYRNRLDRQIATAHMAILLISQDFANSDFIHDFELPRIRKRADQAELLVIPILVGPVDLLAEQHLDWIRERQMLPGKPTPLITYTRSEADFQEVRVEILQAIRNRVRQLRRVDPDDSHELTPGERGVPESGLGPISGGPQRTGDNGGEPRQRKAAGRRTRLVWAATALAFAAIGITYFFRSPQPGRIAVNRSGGVLSATEPEVTAKQEPPATHEAVSPNLLGPVGKPNGRISAPKGPTPADSATVVPETAPEDVRSLRPTAIPPLPVSSAEGSEARTHVPSLPGEVAFRLKTTLGVQVDRLVVGRFTAQWPLFSTLGTEGELPLELAKGVYVFISLASVKSITLSGKTHVVTVNGGRKFQGSLVSGCLEEETTRRRFDLQSIDSLIASGARRVPQAAQSETVVWRIAIREVLDAPVVSPSFVLFVSRRGSGYLLKPSGFRFAPDGSGTLEVQLDQFDRIEFLPDRSDGRVRVTAGGTVTTGKIDGGSMLAGPGVWYLYLVASLGDVHGVRVAMDPLADGLMATLERR